MLTGYAPVGAGIGFAKTSQGNAALIQGLQAVKEQLEPPLNSMPMLVGPSRKGFLGKLTGADWLFITASLLNIKINNILHEEVHLSATQILMQHVVQGGRLQRKGTLQQRLHQHSVWQMGQASYAHTMLLLCVML